jgi:hypothetical protein
VLERKVREKKEIETRRLFMFDVSSSALGFGIERNLTPEFDNEPVLTPYHVGPSCSS